MVFFFGAVFHCNRTAGVRKSEISAGEHTPDCDHFANWGHIVFVRMYFLGAVYKRARVACAFVIIDFAIILHASERIHTYTCDVATNGQLCQAPAKIVACMLRCTHIVSKHVLAAAAAAVALAEEVVN